MDHVYELTYSEHNALRKQIGKEPNRPAWEFKLGERKLIFLSVKKVIGFLTKNCTELFGENGPYDSQTSRCIKADLREQGCWTMKKGKQNIRIIQQEANPETDPFMDFANIFD